MTCITFEESKAIRNELKTTFGKSVKFSVRRTFDMNVLNISVMKSALDLSMFEKGTLIGKGNGKMQGASAEAQAFLAKVKEIARNAPARAGGSEFFNNSDTMRDYSDYSYGIIVEVGKYNKSWESCGLENAAQ
jgi:hypothetical protein